MFIIPHSFTKDAAPNTQNSEAKQICFLLKLQIRYAKNACGGQLLLIFS